MVGKNKLPTKLQDLLLFANKQNKSMGKLYKGGTYLRKESSLHEDLKREGGWGNYLKEERNDTRKYGIEYRVDNFSYI